MCAQGAEQEPGDFAQREGDPRSHAAACDIALCLQEDTRHLIAELQPVSSGI